ncbi:ankyrin repeat and zinc finger domain-containing protein 1 isoform X6 [Aethina tumida]|uniref:ankyrin repeat and zinc finger domain-containing protein 1 isoform X6 n=1 Tax=Aethina tumida TaxID=116153 RepID=UPI00096B0374|nr:ankyrin repeat and zinc finger domain-containing protein 1 isoform X6 [Aethina tumida]
METTSIFDKKFAEIIGESVKSVLLTQTDDLDIKEENVEVNEDTKNESVLSCSYCKVKFPDSLQQRDHYKLDWHRYNLKQSLCGKPPITEEEFDVKTGKDDLSSISGSDSEKEEDNLDTYATAQGKIFLKSETGRVFSLYRCLLLDRKEEVDESTISARFKTTCLDNQQWTILMLGGGHFAGAVFKGVEPILHKTFHCYTVRQGQGGSQTSRDNRGSQPKSAGASLRRYNEQALVQHVKSIVETWRSEIDKSSLIIYRASGPYNRSVLFGGSPSLLDRTDERLRTIPFSTRRATFTELKRVHSILSSTQIYDDEIFDCVELISDGEYNENIADIEYLEVNKTRKFKIPAKKTWKPKTSKIKNRKRTQERKLKIIEAIKTNDTTRFANIIHDYARKVCDLNLARNISIDWEFTFKIIKKLLNEVLDDHGNTILHYCAIYAAGDVAFYAMKEGANPCSRNMQKKTPYACILDDKTKKDFQYLAQTFPNMYNYSKALIPFNRLSPEELVLKRKQERIQKREEYKTKKSGHCSKI